jgi:hypothetical protein
MNERDPFIGRWELDPATLDYQAGRPGRRATYVIDPAPDGLLFTLDAEDADRNPLHFSYGGAIDGIDREIAPGITLALTRLDEQSIESTLTRDGRVADRWTRVLQSDGSMLITQFVVTPDGRELRNTSVYRRIDAPSH